MSEPSLVAEEILQYRAACSCGRHFPAPPESCTTRSRITETLGGHLEAAHGYGHAQARETVEATLLTARRGVAP